MAPPSPVQRLPPLHDLIAFEAAARHVSFLRASEELHVTQSAVSNRIRSLEGLLGVPLFIPINRNIALTSFGERYVADVREILARLETATQRLKNDTRERLRISAAPALGARWLGLTTIQLFEETLLSAAARQAASRCGCNRLIGDVSADAMPPAKGG